MTRSDSEQLRGPWLAGYAKAAAYTGLSETWLRQLVMNGRLPHRKLGRRVMFSTAVLDAWINGGGERRGAA